MGARWQGGDLLITKDGRVRDIDGDPIARTELLRSSMNLSPTEFRKGLSRRLLALIPNAAPLENASEVHRRDVRRRDEEGQVALTYCEGRPYVVDTKAITAGRAEDADAREWLDKGPLPLVGPLSAEARAKLAESFGNAALFEHASVASFGRFALELLAVGAPGDLVEAAHQAALDEIRHARLLFALASAYSATIVAPGMFPFEGRVEISSNLADVAARTIREGCLGETIAACVAAEQASAAKDPAVRMALAQIASDEARHAELAFKMAAWALRVGGPDVREAVSKAIEMALTEASEWKEENHGEADTLAAHGQIGAMAVQVAIERARKDVVEPAAKALLSQSHSPLESTPFPPRVRS